MSDSNPSTPNPSAAPSEQTRIDDLCERLRLEPLDRDLFLANPGPGEGRLFGGLVAAQSVMAAIATVKDGDGADAEPASLLHSIHAYFLRPGRYDLPIRFVVHRIRDGRTFTTRRVVAHQAGEAIFNMAASFARPEEGMSHQQAMPETGPPDGLEEWTTLRYRSLGLPEPQEFREPDRSARTRPNGVRQRQAERPQTQGLDSAARNPARRSGAAYRGARLLDGSDAALDGDARARRQAGQAGHGREPSTMPSGSIIRFVSTTGSSSRRRVRSPTPRAA